MQFKRNPENPLKDAAADLAKNREAISKLAQSSDAQQLMNLLRQKGGVQEAAQAS